MTTAAAYRSDHRPDTALFEESAGTITGFAYAGTLATEIADGGITGAGALELFDDMLAIRELEEMIVPACGRVATIPFRATSTAARRTSRSARRHLPWERAACFRIDDNITSSHRGHGDAVAKGSRRSAGCSDDELRARVPVLAGRHARRSCWRRRSRSTSTTSSPSSSARRRATAPVAAAGCTSATSRRATSAPTRSWAAACRSPRAPRWPNRYDHSDRVVCCFAGDGAYANGVVSSRSTGRPRPQWTNHLAGDNAYGLPVIYFIQNTTTG